MSRFFIQTFASVVFVWLNVSVTTTQHHPVRPWRRASSPPNRSCGKSNWVTTNTQSRVWWAIGSSSARTTRTWTIRRLSRRAARFCICLDRATGQRIWQLPIPRYMAGTIPPFHFDHWKCGICSRPAIDGPYLYVVGPRGDVLCVDRAGQADGNAGPFVDEKSYFGISNAGSYELQPTDGDIVWRFDMIEAVDVIPHDVCGSSPAVCGSYVYACTSNGVDDTHLKVPHPQAPSLIVLHKQTGALVATDGAISGDRILHGTWSSPVVVDIATGRLCCSEAAMASSMRSKHLPNRRRIHRLRPSPPCWRSRGSTIVARASIGCATASRFRMRAGTKTARTVRAR